MFIPVEMESKEWLCNRLTVDVRWVPFSSHDIALAVGRETSNVIFVHVCGYTKNK